MYTSLISFELINIKKLNPANIKVKYFFVMFCRTKSSVNNLNKKNLC